MIYGKFLPDTPVTFSATGGSVSPVNSIITRGLDTTSLFTAGSAIGVADIGVKVDNVTLSYLCKYCSTRIYQS